MAFVAESIQEFIDLIQQRKEGGKSLYVNTGLPLLNEALSGGWRRQSVTYLLGDSGKGKSWLASWMFLAALQQLQEEGAPANSVVGGEVKPPVVVFWSMEMGMMSLMARIIVQLTNKEEAIALDYRRLLEGHVRKVGDPIEREYEPEEREQLEQAFLNTIVTLQNWGNLGYLDFDTLRMDMFRDQMDALATTHDIVMVIVDQFARIDSGALGETMSEDQSEKTDALRTLARDYDCQMMSVLNINRQGQSAGRVKASHIWGGVHAQYDADALIILEWDEEFEERNEAPEEVLVNLTLAKNRVGTEGKVQAYLHRPTGLITGVKK